MSRFRPLMMPLALAVLALIAFEVRVRHQMTDLAVYQAAAHRVWQAAPLYNAADGHYQFKYLPAFALAVAPLAALSDEGARAIWFSVSFGLLVIFVRWSWRGLPEARWRGPALIALTVLCMAKFYGHELTLGQTNVLLGVLFVGAILAVQIDQPVVAAVMIGMAIFVKPYALILVPWIVLTQGRQAAMATGFTVAIGLLAPALVYGWQGNLQLLGAWWQTVSDTTAPNLINPDNVSLAALWTRWVGTGRTAAWLAAASAGGLVMLAGYVWRRRPRVSTPEYLEVALLMLLIPVLSPQGWDYVLLLGTPAVMCLIDRWEDVSVPWRVMTATALALMGLSFFDVMGRTLYGQFMNLSIVTLAAIALAIALAHLRAERLA